MELLDMVKKYLVDNGLDGLCNDGCGCGLDDLAPCGDPEADCQAAVKLVCPKEGLPEKYRHLEVDWGLKPGDVVYVPATDDR